MISAFTTTKKRDAAHLATNAHKLTTATNILLARVPILATQAMTHLFL